MSDELTEHELLHGAWLALELFVAVGKSGTNQHKRFKQHPELKKAYDAALDALHKFYQVAGTKPPEEEYDPQFGDDLVCKCSHTYYRHFDTYEKMAPVGCKYCDCGRFKPRRKR